MFKMIFLPLLASTLFLGNASARDFNIQLKGKSFTGNSTIRLKQEIKKRYPRVNLENFDLERVIIRAKSRRGQGEVYLKVGNFTSRVEMIDGNRRDFNGGGSYYRIPFVSPRQDKGNWQLRLKGNIKVRDITVKTTRVRGNERNDRRRGMTTRSCTYVQETFWGQNLNYFTARATGRLNSGVKASACEKARRRCERARNLPVLTKCSYHK